ncbi:hypothetical protein BJY00DRAFT_318665 [Aspergillus carlsbadensis]|nr:hypothetical protein BJY00DRAFT_318665 [Aspergillus carlsbadensis]
MPRRTLPDHLNGRLILPDRLTAQLSQSSSPLLRLPLELLQMVFDHADPQTRLMLSLTCKWLLFTFSNKLSPDALIHLTEFGRYDMLRLLHPRVPRTLALSLEWNICRRCEKLRPTSTEYWTAKPVAKRPTSRVARMQRLTWAQVMTEFRQKSVELCPGCIMITCLPERLSMLDPRRAIIDREGRISRD